LVVPEDKMIREALLHDSHDAFGHLGAKKTLSALSESFYWPGAAQDVLSDVSSCDGMSKDECQDNKTSREASQLTGATAGVFRRCP
jgi:hypothetical protein